MKLSTMQRALAALLVVTIIWGWTFSWMKEAIDTADAHVGSDALLLVVGLFMMIRFGVASLLMPWLLRGAREGISTRRVWSDGAILASFLLGGFLLQMFGLDGIDPAVSAFLTSLYVAFTAIITGFVERRWPSMSMLVGVIVVTVGAAIISGPPQLTFDLPEWLTVLCAMLFAGHIFATDRITKRSPPLAVAWTSFVWVAVVSTGLFLFGVTQHPEVPPSAIESLLLDPGFLRPVLLAGCLGTMVALSLLAAFQRFLSPVRAAILYALEPVWAAIISITVGQTIVDGWLTAGAIMLFVGNLYVELWPRLRARWASASGRA